MTSTSHTLLRPYKCNITISFPKHEDAERAMKALEVDEEPSDRVVKRFSVEDVNMNV